MTTLCYSFAADINQTAAEKKLVLYELAELLLKTELRRTKSASVNLASEAESSKLKKPTTIKHQYGLLLVDYSIILSLCTKTLFMTFECFNFTAVSEGSKVARDPENMS